MEHALDPIYAARCGVDVDNLYVSQPDTGEQALEIADALIRSGTMDVVVIDSVAALVPRAEIEGEMGDTHVGLQARLMSQALRKLSGVIKQTNTSVIFTNQLREKIGVMFGSPETTPGGNALKFYASVRLDIRRIQAIKSGNDVIGNRTRVKVKKNKVAPPFTECEFDIMYNEGISTTGDVLDLATEFGYCRQARCLFPLQRHLARPGTRECQGISGREPGYAVRTGTAHPQSGSFAGRHHERRIRERRRAGTGSGRVLGRFRTVVGRADARLFFNENRVDTA